ncbi:MAG: hypothetical protein GAK29_00987 [Acinetobacter bereziniae]|uniref:Uncharacterized protein n=1 Tax=Acinetobacter bereziniae TaxID=106648 RepID=A0A833PH42_ACIBZ|nr:MAG: hypothetical protein GAK29_00987 [Acinetobacter bereziniae]
MLENLLHPKNLFNSFLNKPAYAGFFVPQKS